MASTLMSSVLIESDWNLKEADAVGISVGLYSINRIRLEFKVCCKN